MWNLTNTTAGFEKKSWNEIITTNSAGVKKQATVHDICGVVLQNCYARNGY